MFITEGSISLAASYQYVERHTESASLTIWTGDPPRSPSAPPIPAPSRDRLELSSRARIRAAQAEAEERLAELSDEDELDPKVRLAKLIVEILTGKRIRILNAKDLHPGSEAAGQGSEALPDTSGGAGRTAPAPQGWGLVYTEESVYAERQDLAFSAAGVVRTKDGRELAFTLDLAVSREFASFSRLDLRAGDAIRKDPLVINFDGLAAELTDSTFQFDLDADGAPDDMRFVRPGAGFLVFDRNGDGLVNDGRELFGPQTGDGFAELSAHDSDGNGWIDEGDPIYAKLGVWTRAADGSDLLTPLKAANVGAISLAGVGTRFDLKDQTNTLQAETTRLGVWLSEDGQARALQQLDLMV